MQKTQETDEMLMIRYRNGEAAAFDTLYERHKGPLYRFIARQCFDAAVRDELFQDIWLNLIRARTRYEVQAKFTTFLYRIAHNRLIDFYRAAAKHASTETGLDLDTLESPLNDTAARADVARRFEKLKRQIFALPEEQREAFLLHEEVGLSLEEITATTGVGRETAKSRLRYAVKNCVQTRWRKTHERRLFLHGHGQNIEDL